MRLRAACRHAAAVAGAQSSATIPELKGQAQTVADSGLTPNELWLLMERTAQAVAVVQVRSTRPLPALPPRGVLEAEAARHRHHSRIESEYENGRDLLVTWPLDAFYRRFRAETVGIRAAGIA